jgi:hypothetical protein
VAIHDNLPRLLYLPTVNLLLNALVLWSLTTSVSGRNLTSDERS